MLRGNIKRKTQRGLLNHRSAVSCFACITSFFGLDPVLFKGQTSFKKVLCHKNNRDSFRPSENMRIILVLLKPHLALFTGVFIAIGFLSPAKADFRLCNNTSNKLSVALAYTDGETWVSEGWWNLKSSACETLLRGPLAAEFYYVYAMDERSGEWKGKAFMCTRDHEFHIIGRQDCFTRGFDRTGFFEIDTGKEAKNWTVQLTDPAPARPAP